MTLAEALRRVKRGVGLRAAGPVLLKGSVLAEDFALLVRRRRVRRGRHAMRMTLLN